MTTIGPLTPADVDDVVSAVQRDQHVAHRLNRFVSDTLDRRELAEALATRRSPTWIARDGARFAGHLTASVLADPSGSSSAWISPDAASFDRPSTLARLYAEAGERWIGDGVDEHVTWVYDRPDVSGPWLELGFARAFRRGSLDLTAPRSTSLPPGYRRRRGSVADLDVALELTGAIDDDDARGPSFAASAPLVRDELAETLSDPDTIYHLIDYRGETVAQVIAFPLLPVRGAYPHTLHLSAVVVRPAHRGRGVATAMLDDLLHGARRGGYEYADVTWRTSNPAAAAFWSAYGATPTYVRLRRRIDLR